MNNTTLFNVIKNDIFNDESLIIRIRQLESEGINISKDYTDENESKKKLELIRLNDEYKNYKKMTDELDSNIGILKDFEKYSKEYIVLNCFIDCFENLNSLAAKEAYTAKENCLDNLKMIDFRMYNILDKYKSVSLLRNGKFDNLENILQKNNYLITDISNMHEKYIEKIEKESLGINLEIYNKIQTNKNKLINNNIVLGIEMLDAPAYIKLEPIFIDVKHKLYNLNFNNNSSVEDDDYTILKDTYISIILDYQSIQNSMLIKNAFSNTTAKDYLSLIDIDIDKKTNKILDRYEKVRTLEEKLVALPLENKQDDDKRKNNNISDDSRIEKLFEISNQFSELESKYYQEYLDYEIQTGEDIKFIDYLIKIEDNVDDLIRYHQLKIELINLLFEEYENKYNNTEEINNNQLIDKTKFIDFCTNESNIIKSLGGMDSVIKETDIDEFYELHDQNLKDEEKEI